jgi:lipoprotein-anchoring transpeptidase ErfK/SrfK
MFDRRSFLASGLALGGFGLAPAVAHRAADYTIPEEHLPRMVRLKTKLEPGEIHVDPNTFALYWTLPKREAIRYTVGVGRDELYHAGTFVVGAKREWPSWTPTPEMIKRDPKQYEQWADGMPGGINNPLGARALYLFTADKRDTYLRIHGTSQPWTIASAVSNGCARLVNDHAIDLYNRVPIGTRVVLNEKTKLISRA